MAQGIVAVAHAPEGYAEGFAVFFIRWHRGLHLQRILHRVGIDLSGICHTEVFYKTDMVTWLFHGANLQAYLLHGGVKIVQILPKLLQCNISFMKSSFCGSEGHGREEDASRGEKKLGQARAYADPNVLSVSIW